MVPFTSPRLAAFAAALFLLLTATPAPAAGEDLVRVHLGVFDNVPASPEHRAAGLPEPEPIRFPESVHYAARSLLPPIPSAPNSPHVGAAVTGTQKVITIAIQFSDKVGTTSSTTLNDAIYNTAGNSVARFYAEDSYGAISVTGAIASTGTSIWLTSSRTHAYYGADGSGCSLRSTDGANVCIWELAREAVRLANPHVDFSTYDANGDGDIDHLAVVAAGGDQSFFGSPATDIWPHRWVIWTPTAGHAATTCLANANHGSGVGELVDGKCAYSYFMQSETTPMGTFVHEFGHSLGLPDLYDTNGGSEGVGEWDVEGTGNWLGPSGQPGTSPAFHSAHSKMWLGWLTPTTYTSAQTVTLSPQSGSTGVRAARIDDYDGNTGTYFLVEYRNRNGAVTCTAGVYDSCLAAKGALVWHVDEAKYNAGLSSNTVNADETNKGLDLEEADESPIHSSDLDNEVNRMDAFDPYYAGNGHAGYEGVFGPSTTPNSAAKTGPGSLPVTLSAFSAPGATLSFSLGLGSDTTPPVTTLHRSPGPNANGWNSGDVAVTFSATDAGAGVAWTRYRLGGGAWQTGTGPVSVASEGSTLVEYQSQDTVGNLEPVKSETIRIDKSAPAVVITSPVGVNTGTAGYVLVGTRTGTTASITVRVTEATAGQQFDLFVRSGTTSAVTTQRCSWIDQAATPSSGTAYTCSWTEPVAVGARSLQGQIHVSNKAGHNTFALWKWAT